MALEIRSLDPKRGSNFEPAFRPALAAGHALKKALAARGQDFLTIAGHHPATLPKRVIPFHATGVLRSGEYGGVSALCAEHHDLAAAHDAFGAAVVASFAAAGLDGFGARFVVQDHLAILGLDTHLVPVWSERAHEPDSIFAPLRREFAALAAQIPDGTTVVIAMAPEWEGHLSAHERLEAIEREKSFSETTRRILARDAANSCCTLQRRGDCAIYRRSNVFLSMMMEDHLVMPLPPVPEDRGLSW